MSSKEAQAPSKRKNISLRFLCIGTSYCESDSPIISLWEKMASHAVLCLGILFYRNENGKTGKVCQGLCAEGTTYFKGRLVGDKAAEMARASIWSS
jgi:hypothetical protein